MSWSLFALALATFSVGTVLSWSVPDHLPPSAPLLWSETLTGVAMLAYAAVGALIAARHPSNPVGWLFIAIGLMWELRAFAVGYTSYGLSVGKGSLPAAEPIMLLTTTWVIPYGLVPILVLLFPNGRLPAAHWRPGVGLAGLGLFVALLTQLFRPGLLSALPGFTNPLGIEALAEEIEMAMAFSMLTMLGTYALAAASVVVRLRRGPSEERMQVRWLCYAAAANALVLATLITIQVTPPLQPLNPDGVYAAALFLGIPAALALAAIPAAAGIAILRYRLYDIDVLINRTLVYGSLTATLLALHILVVGSLSLLFRTNDSLPISLIFTGLVSVLFQPLRERLQRGVNHLLYGERDDPYRVVSRLGERLQDAIAPEVVLTAIVQTVREALRLPYAAIALKREEGLSLAIEAGIPHADPLRLPLVHQGELLGELVVGRRGRGDLFSSSDRRLLHALARQAGAAVHAMQLMVALQQSRERLVATREEERRRLRGDLHDGLGSALAGLTLKIEVARNRLVPLDPSADPLFAELVARTQAAVSEIRRLVYALRPPALDELGLVGALRETASQYSHHDLRISVEAPETLPPLPAAVEVAAYRIGQEALANVVRHAGACSCVLRLTVPEGKVQLEVSDNGRGLPAGWTSGVGMVSMRERAAELGGGCTIESPPSGGTRVLATIPFPGTQDSSPREDRGPVRSPGAVAVAEQRGVRRGA